MKLSLRGLAAGAALALTLGIASVSQAQTTALSFAPGAEFTNGNWSLGWIFNLSSAVTVTELGFYDDNGGDGLIESHEVGIYNSAGTLLVSGTVNPGDTLIGNFRYTGVAPTALAAGNGYVIMAVTGRENYGFSGSVATAPEVTYAGDKYDVAGFGSGVLSFGDTSNGTQGWFGPNFRYDGSSVVPEPSEWAAMGLGALGVGGLMVRARRRK